MKAPPPFEALVLPTVQEKHDHGHKSFDYEKQVPCSVGYFVITRCTDFHRDYRSCTGEDCIRRFIEEMTAFEQEAMLHYFDEKRMIITTDKQRYFEQATQS